VSRPTMFTLAFLWATLERMVRGGAAAVGAALVVGPGPVNAFALNWVDVGGLFLGGALVSLILSLGGGTLGAGAGPSFLGRERLARDWTD
jgi:hypothetical protein